MNFISILKPLNKIMLFAACKMKMRRPENVEPEAHTFAKDDKMRDMSARFKKRSKILFLRILKMLVLNEISSHLARSCTASYDDWLDETLIGWMKHPETATSDIG